MADDFIDGQQWERIRLMLETCKTEILKHETRQRPDAKESHTREELSRRLPAPRGERRGSSDPSRCAGLAEV